LFCYITEVFSKDSPHPITIEVKNVSYSKKMWKGRRFEDKVFLNNINYTLKPGTVTAV
jgi:ABC-type multidrug transport system fused ATPase/permease subunit